MWTYSRPSRFAASAISDELACPGSSSSGRALTIVRNRFGSAGGDPGPAYGHARSIIDIEKALGLYIEPGLQEWYLDLPARGLIRLWNVYYGLAHFVVTLVALMWLFRRDPERYPLWRNTLALTTCLAVIGFAAYSLMPATSSSSK